MILKIALAADAVNQQLKRNPKLKEHDMKNWKTTLFGWLTGAALGYAGYKTGNPELIIAGFGAAGFGMSSKDGNVTGGTVQQ